MTIVTKQYLTKDKVMGGVPFGNKWVKRFNLTTNAAGGIDQSNLLTALQIGDTARIGIIPAGTELHDIQAIISTAFTAAVTASVGFAYVDGVDSTVVPQDPAYFVPAASLALNATGVSRKTSVTAPVVLPKDAYLTLLTAGAVNAKVGVVDIIVQGIATGAN